MIFNLLSKILAGVAGVLLITCLVFYSMILGKTNTITMQQTTIGTLQVDKRVLEERVEACQMICKATSSAKEMQQEEIDSLRETEAVLLEKLLKSESTKNENKDGSPEGATGGSGTATRSGMLNSHCERVRGSPCPNP